MTLKILIIEDVKDSADSFKELLEMYGHNADIALTGAEAKAIVETNRYDLVFMDLNLPDINGIELIGDLRKINLSHTTKYIVVSGQINSNSPDQDIISRFDGYLEKPIVFEKLLAMLNNY